MELSTWILFGIFCFCLLIFGVLDKLSKSAKKYGDLLYCVANAFKDYSLCFLVSSIVDFFCTNIFNSGIFSMIIDIESVGIKVLILLVIIGWLVKVAYINRNIYKTILIKRVRFENDNGQLKNCCKQLSLSKKQ